MPYNGKGRPRETLEARFWPKVDVRGADECWPWIGSLNNEGYGLIWADNKVQRAHRVAWTLAGRELPAYRKGDGRSPVLDHTCRLRSCVNVKHLRLTTQYVNTTENSESPHAKNIAKVRCHNGHLFAGDNLAVIPHRDYRSKRFIPVRVCLTCFPCRWMYAVIERPPTSDKCRRKWVGPFNPEAK